MTFFVSLAVPTFVCGLLVLNDHQQRSKIARYFTEILRYEIMRGSTRDAVFQAQRMALHDGPFFRVRYQDNKQGSLIDQRSPDEEPWVEYDIEIPVVYSNTENFGAAGHMTYSSGLDRMIQLSIAIFLLWSVAAWIFLSRQRRNVALRIEQEISLRRNELIARTVNSLAHDLRAPLGMLEIFVTHPEEAKTQRESAKQSLLRIHAMVDSLRHNAAEQLVKPGSGTFDANYILGLTESLAYSKGITQDVQGPRVCLLYADHSKLERVLQNLVVNAIEAAQDRVVVSFVNESDAFIFTVRDDGPGVSSEALPRLFERGATFGKSGGTGLGLAYCKAVVEGHGGTLEHRRVESWTLFAVRIPVSQKFTQPIVGPLAPHIPGIKVWISLANEMKSQALRDAIQEKHGNLEVLATKASPDLANLVISDNLDLLSANENSRQTLVFVHTSDDVETIRRKLESRLQNLQN